MNDEQNQQTIEQSGSVDQSQSGELEMAGQEIPNQLDREEKGLDEDELMELEAESKLSGPPLADTFIAFEDVELAYTIYVEVEGNEEAISNLTNLLLAKGLDSRFYFGRTLYRDDAVRLAKELDWHELAPGSLKHLDEFDVDKLKTQKISIFITPHQHDEHSTESELADS